MNKQNLLRLLDEYFHLKDFMDEAVYKKGVYPAQMARYKEVETKLRDTVQENLTDTSIESS